jgi:hypothetical protein
MNDNVVELQKRVSGLEIIELYEEIKRLELDLQIHEQYRVNASSEEFRINEYLIDRTMRTLSQLYKSQHYER